jgi:hypothetical protein
MTRSTVRLIPKEASGMIDQEHSEILRRYIELDDAILHAHGSPQIIDAARRLVKMLLLHLSAQERSLEQSSKKNLIPELQTLEAGLMHEEVYAALRVRGLCRRWMSSQTDREERGVSLIQ